MRKGEIVRFIMISLLVTGWFSAFSKAEADPLPITKVIDVDKARLKKDPVRIRNRQDNIPVSIKGDIVSVAVEYAGGCEKHDFALLLLPGFAKTYPPTVDLYLVHDAHGDSCKKLSSGTYEFELTTVKDALKQAFQEYNREVNLRIYYYDPNTSYDNNEDKPDYESILYEWSSYAQSNSRDTKESRFGVQGGIEKFSDEMRKAGVEITREWIVWDQIERVEDQYDWTVMDGKVKKANSAGIEILGYFINMPSWTKKEQKDLEPGFPINKKYPPKKKGGQKPPLFNKKTKASDFCEPKDINDFKKFAKAVAERYDGKHGHGEMKYIEILNEVNVPEFFDFKDPDNPYELWLVNGYQGIKEGNPNAEVLIGAFFDPIDTSGNPPNLFVKQFIERMLRDYSQYYDIVNFHSYSKESDGITRTTQYIKELIQAYDVNKPMWITETATLIGVKQAVNQEQMAKEVIKRYVRAFGEGVEKVFWYLFVGSPTATEDPAYGSNSKILGLGWDFPKNSGKGTKFHPRQAYDAYKLMASKLAGFTSVKKISDTQYEFTVNGKSVYVLWADTGISTLPSDLKGTVKVTDYLGNKETKLASEIVLTESPIFVEEATK